MDEMAELQMQLLEDEAARKLLFRHALARQPASHANTLPTSISENLVHEVTRECGGLPLCLMLTARECHLYRRSGSSIVMGELPRQAESAAISWC
jgi:hypothetical protein